MEEMSISRAITELNISRTIKGVRCIVRFPEGVSSLFDAFSTHLDKQISIPGLFRLFELAIGISNRALPDDPNTFLDHKPIFADKFVYVGSCKLEIHQSFNASAYFHLPFDVFSTLDYVGKSSYCKVQEMCQRDNSQWFARLSQQNIMVDPVTRKPLELPASWRKKYGPMCTGSPFVMEKLNRPDACMAVGHYKIQTSDIDSQNHTNWVVHVEICMNACRNGLDKELFSKPLIKNSKNGLKEIQIRYVNEALVDEEVVIHAWETSGRDDQLCFELTRGSDVCIQATIAFHQFCVKSTNIESIKSKI
eukprot:XP_011437329.1 PREDICTED: uncharacterized protein LOC105335229 [Crassostrea gigas]